jgi:hypothetical protein
MDLPLLVFVPRAARGSLEGPPGRDGIAQRVERGVAPRVVQA